VGSADSEFEGLDLSVNVVDAPIRGSRFVNKVETDDDEDKDDGKEIEHRHR
jgi:hypothetical protein